KVDGLTWFDWAPDSGSIYFMTSGDKPESGDYTRLYDPRERLTDWDKTSALHVIDARGITRKQLTIAGDFALTQCAVSPRGDKLALVRRVAIAERPFFESEFWVLDPATGAHQLIRKARFPFENGPANLTFSPDGKKIAFTAPPAESGLAGEVPEHNAFDTCLFVLDLETAEMTRLSDRFSEAVIGNLTWRREDGKIYFIAQHRSFTKIARIDPAGDKGLSLLEVPATVVEAISVSAQADRLAWIGSTLDRPNHLRLLDLNGEGSVPPGLIDPNADLMMQLQTAAWERFNFENEDGDQIDGWIFYPPGFDENQAWPMVVYYYGGVAPEIERFSVLYYQWLTAHGYVLYVVNPRGAVGFGRDFADAHCNDWGEGAGQDIIEGVQKVLEAKPFVDPDRIGAYGGSYGGFMTLSLITECNLFKAACSMYGISNLASYWGAGIWGYTYGDTAMAASYPWTRRDVFVDRSPLFKADKVNAALLLLHGDADTNVPVVESEQMFTALKVLGREVAYVRFAGEDHGIAGKPSNLKAHREMILEWFDKHLKDQPRGWDGRWEK
ncbi:MAG: prolyl oligopeptidase family serine peptidase, partial [Planctomycetes bacterium]|nr:prolyl oligopeptidase family serine peptidase [Planctomycetota bacterium]